jgi:hypothetical protein
MGNERTTEQLNQEFGMKKGWHEKTLGEIGKVSMCKKNLKKADFCIWRHTLLQNWNIRKNSQCVY